MPKMEIPDEYEPPPPVPLRLHWIFGMGAGTYQNNLYHPTQRRGRPRDGAAGDVRRDDRLQELRSHG